MTTLRNLQRDGFWLPQADQAQAMQTPVTLANPEVDQALPVHEVAAGAFTAVGTMTQDVGYSYGVKISQPTIETNPYRFKGYCDIAGAGDNVVMYFVGYAQSGNDVVENPIYFPASADGRIDEILMIEPTQIAGFDTRALAFGCLIVAGAPNADSVASLSVQRLSKAPPRYGAVVA